MIEGLTFDPRAHVYRFNGHVRPSVTQILFSWSPISRLDPEMLAAAAALGTDVHDATALDDRRELDEESVDELVAPFLRAWRRFRAETGFEPTSVEEMIYNATHGFAGTLDREGRFSGKWYAPYPSNAGENALLEIKTGAKDPTHALQTAAYWTTRGHKRRTLRGAVYLRPDGSYALEWFTQHARDWATFLAAVARHQWKLTHGI